MMKRLFSLTAVGMMMLATAACMSSGTSDTQSGGSNATAEQTERGVPTE